MELTSHIPYICSTYTTNKLKNRLSDLCSIQSGIYAKPDYAGEVVYLQAKHFDERGQLATTLLPDLFLSSQTRRHLLQPGDVVFAAKGHKNFAAVYDAHNGPCVASSTFLVLRISEHARTLLLPGYLAWLFNSPAVQIWLKSKAIGSALPSISKAALAELELDLPPVQAQRIILKIAALHEQEKILHSRLAQLREKRVQQLILNTFRTSKP